MSQPVISVNNLSKRYFLRTRQQRRATTFVDFVKNTLISPFDYIRSTLRSPSEEETLWALRNVSFEIGEGEIVGVIGRNGSGKSTLLKLLSRITRPTEGEAEIHGRVASLIEVGTGFHPDLSGRENVYLNGTILGMRKAEIDERFDEIVDFAGIGKFIDIPVKYYSSGMGVRLGFAVAAHLHPEILLVDEVLAVGDADFQKKCLGKMDAIARSGRTILFVSHNMATIENLCSRSILLDHGKLVSQGPTSDVIQEYLTRVLPAASAQPLATRTDRRGNESVRFTSFHVEAVNGQIINAARSGQDIVLVFGYTTDESDPPRQVSVGFGLFTQQEQPLFVFYSSDTGQDFAAIPPKGYFRCTIPHLPLKAGRYRVDARVVVLNVEADWPDDGVGYFDVETGDFFGTGMANLLDHPAPLLINGDWTCQEYTEAPQIILS